MSEKPKISIITPSKNTGRFAEETIESILAQTYKNWEHIVVDGGSTDETLDVLWQYPHIRLISEPDNGFNEAFSKGLRMAEGEYVMLCCISDGYLNKNWFKRCVEILDCRPEISLVWGIDQNMLDDGVLDKIVCNSWFKDPPPNEMDYIHYWLKTGQLFHERDFCVRKNVIKECLPPYDPAKTQEEQGLYTFTYNFNRRGYLPHFIPILAAYGRLHENAGGHKEVISGKLERDGREYYRQVEGYKQEILEMKVKHCYRDGFGKPLANEFKLRRYLKFNTENKLEKIIKYLLPPIFSRLKDKLSARYRVHMNKKKIRKGFQIN